MKAKLTKALMNSSDDIEEDLYFKIENSNQQFQLFCIRINKIMKLTLVVQSFANMIYIHDNIVAIFQLFEKIVDFKRDFLIKKKIDGIVSKLEEKRDSSGIFI